MKGNILTLDVAFKNTGWSVLNGGSVIACGVIITEKTKKKGTRSADDHYDRSSMMASELKRIIEDYAIKGIVGELPSGGALSSTAMKCMASATSIVASVAACMNVPCDWCTPTDVKLAVCEYRSATKGEMMDTIREKFKNKGSELFPKTKGAFEHIADSLGAFLALQNSNIVRIYG